ncbi:amino acid ABC transporter substrate-binding protein [Paracoccus liaowanqingii]|uniref:Amino acid ABC transporter substrate-binding protein n=1 Tax=Paracoccus liaowanqingii TaxID=2560053 RepID=A0A4Z1CLR0_9RHOB|nr:transporter substrate-binding domain-containing protein [Paracoccus liaowanqingii]TGN61855.1 amino acid ABC transporter substrate-binding protein [Paracoccus liaowanqingii]
MDSTWRVGLLFSRSGATGLPESEHARGVTLAVDEINQSGGVLGKSIEIVSCDPCGDHAQYRYLAERLMTEDGVSVIFGCYSSDTRKLMLRTVERRNGLLWYPSSYEGFEYSPNILYAGPVASQCVFPLADYLTSQYGGRAYFAGSDYIFPHETNRVMRDLVEARGGSVVGETYLPLAAPLSALERLIIDIRRHQPDFVFSTLVGETGQTFLRMYHDAGFDISTRPIASMSMAEAEVARIGADKCKGIITAASYFSTLDTEPNRNFHATANRLLQQDWPLSMWMASSYAQVHFFARALKIAQSLDTDHLLQAAAGMEFEAPEGSMMIDADNNHAWLTPRIGRANASGKFDIVWSSPELVRPDPYLANSPTAPVALKKRQI